MYSRTVFAKQVPMTCKLGQFGMGKCRNDVTVVLFSLDSASKEPRTLGIPRVMHSFSESHYPLPFVAYLPPNNDLSSLFSSSRIQRYTCIEIQNSNVLDSRVYLVKWTFQFIDPVKINPQDL